MNEFNRKLERLKSQLMTGKIEQKKICRLKLREKKSIEKSEERIKDTEGILKSCSVDVKLMSQKERRERMQHSYVWRAHGWEFAKTDERSKATD